MGIQIKLQIEIDDVSDVQLLHALESLLKNVKSSNVVQTGSDTAVAPAPRRRKPPKPRFADAYETAARMQFLKALVAVERNLGHAPRFRRSILENGTHSG